jgi:uncharacterized repeat protein (TIGR01451 family)
MNLSRYRRAVVVLAGIACLAVGASPIGATTSNPSPVGGTVQTLLGFTTNTIPQVTSGDTVAYLINVANTSGNSANHVIFTDTVDQGAAFVSDDSPLCSGSGSTMTCAIGQMAAGASFSVRVAFKVPTVSATTTITNTLNGTLDPQTPNGTNSRVNDTFSASASASVVAASDSLESTYGFPGTVVKTRPISATHLQNTEVDLPSTLTSGFGTPTEVVDALPNPSGGCALPTCIPNPFFISIPDSESPATNPFVDSVTNALFPYTWTIQFDPSLVSLLNGKKLTAVYHAPASNPAAFTKLPLCANSPVSLTTPICVDQIFQDKRTKIWFATGRGLENGNWCGG